MRALNSSKKFRNFFKFTKFGHKFDWSVLPKPSFSQFQVFLVKKNEMKKLKIINRPRITTLAQIQQFEQSYQLKLPDFLREFLLEYSGAFVYENSIRKNITIEFLALYPSGCASIDAYMPEIRTDFQDEYTIHRNDLIPFALDIYDRIYCVSIGMADWKSVYHIQLEDKVYLTRINTFEAFINHLYRDREADKLTDRVRATGFFRDTLFQFFFNKDYDAGVQTFQNALHHSEKELLRWEEAKQILNDPEVLLLPILQRIYLPVHSETEARTWWNQFLKDLKEVP
jgi:hypothetical protein